MASHASSASSLPVSAAADPAFWTQDFSDTSSLALHLSPGGSSTTHTSSPTPPAQTPKSDSAHGPAAARASVAVACVPCRSRHLKCDGGVRCSRCKADGVECTYIKSRRGWKGKRKNKGENGAPTGSGPENETVLHGPLSNSLATTTIALPSPGYDFGSELSLVDQLSSAPNSLSLLASAPPVGQFNLNGTQRTNQFGTTGPPNAIGAFFHFFYGSHPFCLPRPRLVEFLKERRAPLLELAVQYIGSSFLPSVPTDIYKEALNRTIASQNYPKDGYTVQALLLFSIGLHANNDVPRAAQIFGMAQAMTVEIGLHRSDYAIINGNNDRVLEESWRRTWWSMYTVNGMMAAVNPGVQFRLKDIATDVPLPCENDEYFSGQIPYARTIQEYDDSAFAPEEMVFSSFAYLIDAIRILGKVFEVSRLDSTFEYHIVDVVDQYLINWKLHLPVSKTEIINDHGQIDELLFQAHMVHSGSTIMLHRPRSSLGFGRVENVNICVQPGQVLLPTQTREVHTSKCLFSAENISTLIKLPGPLIHHTPFFTCVVVMASVVHLSYWSFLVPDGQDDVIKQSIRLDVGTLQQYSHTWPIAAVVLGQVRGVAHTLFNSKKAMSIHLWSSIAQDDIIRGVIEDGGSEPLENYSQLLTPMLKS
ncbi:uncharacterized protein BDR25DRAFT_30155 [Lindgomyces ingoldianus]|uniref:Uncharacterized protein n=1 Tax=Lindgomyces ingoldianus TaxID=673940 RepID=A0ACB6QVX0_9PLEO|nr:uncharacterized protein BDR25DRAFT_30155 [Lindgomyces ingoldianus]KAF2471076.1 hypothetical protein BDR25DRAFT_30155 [Lindgomyces ingoldianus]